MLDLGSVSDGLLGISKELRNQKPKPSKDNKVIGDLSTLDMKLLSAKFVDGPP